MEHIVGSRVFSFSFGQVFNLCAPQIHGVHSVALVLVGFGNPGVGDSLP